MSFSEPSEELYNEALDSFYAELDLLDSTFVDTLEEHIDDDEDDMIDSYLEALEFQDNELVEEGMLFFGMHDDETEL